MLGKEKVYLVKIETKKEKEKVEASEENTQEQELFDMLKAVRTDLAQKEDVPAYLIFSDATLLELATYLPQTMEDVRKISGFGDVKLAKYGKIFLEAVVNYCDKNKLTTRISEKIPKRERVPKLVTNFKKEKKKKFQWWKKKSA